MDLFADELLAEASRMPSVSVTRVQPRLVAPLSGILGASRKRWVENAERASGRYLEYPLRLLTDRTRFDRFHLIDHSYAHLMLLVPPGTAGVYCHDIDAFRPLVEDRPVEAWRRALAGLLLRGMRRASVVFYSTDAVRREIEAHGLVESERLVHAPPGVAADFRPEPGSEDRTLAEGRPYLLHVGSLIPRKNPHFLLRLAATVLAEHPELEFVQVGGEFSEAMLGGLRDAGVLERVRRVRDVSRGRLAALYRSAKLVVLPSLAEGFGLPIIEALSCGAPVIASDLPVLRQVGGDAVTYVAPDQFDGWTGAARAVLANGAGPSREKRLSVAARYSWRAHADTIVRAHEKLALGAV